MQIQTSSEDDKCHSLSRLHHGAASRDLCIMVNFLIFIAYTIVSDSLNRFEDKCARDASISTGKTKSLARDKLGSASKSLRMLLRRESNFQLNSEKRLRVSQKTMVSTKLKLVRVWHVRSLAATSFLCHPEPENHIDNEYSRAGTSDPKIVVTTSRDPSSKLQQFAKVCHISNLCIL